MTLSAMDKKDDKKGDKDKDKHQPVPIIVWEGTWPWVMREASTQDIVTIPEILVEEGIGSR